MKIGDASSQILYPIKIHSIFLLVSSKKWSWNNDECRQPLVPQMSSVLIGEISFIDGQHFLRGWPLTSAIIVFILIRRSLVAFLRNNLGFIKETVVDVCELEDDSHRDASCIYWDRGTEYQLLKLRFPTMMDFVVIAFRPINSSLHPWKCNLS